MQVALVEQVARVVLLPSREQPVRSAASPPSRIVAQPFPHLWSLFPHWTHPFFPSCRVSVERGLLLMEGHPILPDLVAVAAGASLMQMFPRTPRPVGPLEPLSLAAGPQEGQEAEEWPVQPVQPLLVS